MGAWLRLVLEAPADQIDLALERLREAGASAFEIQDASTWVDPERPLAPGRARAIAYVEDVEPDEARARLGAGLGPGWTVQVEPFLDESWKETWKRFLRPAVVTSRLAVGPPWDLPTAPPGGRAIVLDPGLAFGSGTHPTTRLCLERLDAILAAGPVAAILDLGCGAGALAIGAALLSPGSTRVVAVDLDPEAVRATRENARASGVAGRVEVLEGSLERVRGPFDLVLANLLAEILVDLAPGIAGVLETRGRGVLSGILEGREPAVERASSAAGLEVRDRRRLEGWTMLEVARARP